MDWIPCDMERGRLGLGTTNPEVMTEINEDEGKVLHWPACATEQ